MGRRRARYPPKVTRPNAMDTRFGLFTYTLSRLPPRQLPFLALYAYATIYACKHGWIDQPTGGKAGAAVLGVLSMVTGLLLSYRFSTAVAKWDEGKQVWVGVRTTIRDGVRMLSIPASPAAGSPSSSLEDLGSASTDEVLTAESDTHSRETSGNSSRESREKPKKVDIVVERTDELTGLLVGFAFALQHHLHHTRPLPQPPLCDILPPAYLSSLKRTEARVRFAESHSGPSGGPLDDLRPGLRRRPTGPPTEEEKYAAGWDGEWDLETIRLKAGDAFDALSSVPDDPELRQQIDQLNIPENDTRAEKSGVKIKSNLTSPNPPNLPLALLRLMEGYVIGLADVPAEKGGWAEAKRERMLGVVKSLNAHLGEAERLSTNPPPLPLTLHLNHLLLIYLAALPPSLLCVVTHPILLVTITIIAGWCLLGLEALISEVGGVFGFSENHHPLPVFANQILLESVDLNHRFLACYRARLVNRLGDDDEEVRELDRRCRKSGEDWIPRFE